MTFIITLGDPSSDGHGKQDQYTIKTECTKEQIIQAYGRGCDKWGYDLTEDICSDFEDNQFGDELVEALEKVGIPKEKYLTNWELNTGRKWKPDGYYEMTANVFFRLWLEIIRLGEPPHPVEEFNHNGEIYIGAYGLFY